MQHSLEQPMLCIDPKNAMYVTPKELHGPRLPVHVIKSVLSGKICCESEICRDMARIAARRGNLASECNHLKRSSSAQCYVPPAPLNPGDLDRMFNKGLISKSRLQECKEMHLKASEEEVDCVFPIFWGEYGLSETYIYFSVFTNLTDNWCRLGRTIVTFDKTYGKWHSQCRGTKNRLSCVHRYLCMWWIFQEWPEYLQNDVTPEEIEDLEEQAQEIIDETQPTNESSSGVMKMTEYFLKCKRIPENLQQDLITTEMPIPESFVPEETQCPYCPGPCPPNLGEAVLKTKHATIYALFSVHRVHLMRRPDLTNTTSQDTQVNVTDRWENIEKEIIATGFSDESASNPFASSLTYSAFPPWIGQCSRLSDVIPKTEILKGLSQKDRLWTKRPSEEVDEDSILQILDTKGPRKEDLAKACNALGVSSSGSQSDLLNRLEELLLYKDIYPKMFVKLHKAGGGVLHLGCTHGVVYYHSPLWWQESARDHGYALLSFKYPPTVFISDIA
ncbi:hypothetical protein E1301_Tti018150s11, partial [Triplophysa tibetana]